MKLLDGRIKSGHPAADVPRLQQPELALIAHRALSLGQSGCGGFAACAGAN